MSAAMTIPDTNRRAGRLGQGEGSAMAVEPVTFTLPVPPSVNQLFRNVPGQGRVKTRVYDDWQGHARTSLRLQNISPIKGQVLVLFGVERQSLAADIDNRIKAMLDVIVKAKIIRDDSNVTAFAAAWLPAANGLAHVQIFPAEGLGIEFHPSPDRATGGWFVPALSTDGEPNGPID